MKRYPVVLAAGCVFVLAGLLLWKKWEAETRYDNPSYSYGMIVRNRELEQIALRRRKTYIARAREGREFYREWANRHKDVIRKIASTDPSDEKAIAKLYEELPHSQKEAGIPWGKMSDVVRSESDTSDVNKYIFSWQISGHANAIEASMPVAKAGLSSERDLPLSESLSGVGNKAIVLWASGRLTERNLVLNPVKTPGSTMLVERHEQIEPPFF